MESFIIEGGRLLSGTITPQGAKNEALQVISATLLTSDAVHIKNVPDILDVNNLIQLLRDMGVSVTKENRTDYTFQAKDLNLEFLQSDEFVRKCSALRGSVLLIGPLLGRFGKAVIAEPGGDKIGRRRLDTHFLGFKKLGAKFVREEERNVYDIEARRLKGCYMLLDEASVTGTANIIMAAVLAEGTTTIYNAACEPYIQQLCHLLNAMGAQISGIASNLLTIVGVKSLHGADHTILPDMIEVGSFIGMAAMVGDGITIKNVSLRNLGIIPDAFRRLGIKIKEDGDDLYIPRQPHYAVESFIDGTIMTLADAPWPGLTPDLLSVLLVVATQARGTVLIHQKMFESRLFFVDKLIDMGAQIILCDPHRAVVVGHDRKIRLRARRMTSPDIRAGIALLIAALSANGTSRIANIAQIDRGYENIEQRLIRKEEVYQIGRIGKPHGVKGEVLFHFSDDVFDRTESEYLILEVDGILVPFFMEEYRFRSDETALVRFCDINTQEEARELTGCDVYFLRSEVPEDDDQLTWAQIVGFSIIDEQSGRSIGTISAVDDSTINTLFELRTPDGRDVLIPASDNLIADVDTESQTITMTIPEGLLDL